MPSCYWHRRGGRMLRRGNPRKGDRRDQDRPRAPELYRQDAGHRRSRARQARRGPAGREVGDPSAELKGFILDHVDPVGSMLMSDALTAYNGVGAVMRHAVINHAVRYVDGSVHTNAIQGFWSRLKRA